MYKLIVFAFIVAMCAIHLLAAPVDEFEASVGHRRVTCDVLSFEAKGVKLNHAACAAHCLAMGKRGGRCNNGVCVCRR
uniref:Defensin n=1 Tax=Mylabris quadripunctata TaxID=268458 RepID=A0A9E8MA01_9CUCU|nr:defensin [Mylabris quadripunctata]